MKIKLNIDENTDIINETLLTHNITEIREENILSLIDIKSFKKYIKDNKNKPINN